MKDSRSFVNSTQEIPLRENQHLAWLEPLELRWIDQFMQWNADGASQCIGIVDRDVDRAAFNAAQVPPRYPGIKCQALLGYVLQTPGATQVAGKNFTGGWLLLRAGHKP